MSNVTQQNLDLWQNAALDPETRRELDHLIKEEPEKIEEGFYTKLSFGTGGLRGIMGIGTNRMNIYTVGMATQGLANYLLKQEGPHKVFIGYDCRHNSRLFAETTARVLAANGIKAIVTKELRPTPYVSFGCRHLKCSAAIMITASHNPPEYNGYKVYWNNGGQVVPPHDRGIIEQVNLITSLDQVKKTDTFDHPLISEVQDDVDNAYLDAIAAQQLTPEINREKGGSLKVIYSNLHGTGITLMPRAMKSWGFTNFSTISEQDAPVGNFPTVKSPNPEEKSALALGIAKLEADEGDILIATDPDADRVGMAVRHQGETYTLSGNQVASLLIDHICRSHPNLPSNAAFVKTIGTTELFRDIALAHHASCFDVLTGFKYIAEKIEQWEKDPNGLRYIFGGEESYGYLLGTHAYDKDAIISSTLIAEAALSAKLEGITLVDRLHQLWKTYGIHIEQLSSLVFPETQEGHSKMKNGMERLQKEPPTVVNGIPVTSIEDYNTSLKTILQTGQTEPLDLPKSSVLRFWLEDGSKLMIRPSGTEPKVKFYCGVKSKDFENIEEGVKKLEAHAEDLINSLKNLF